MDDKTQVIHHDIEATRASLVDKVETLEQTVVDTVQGTTNAVAETVDTVKEAVQSTVEQVKDTVQGTVEAVKETFDLSLQVERHPWLMFGGSVGVGYLAAALLTPRAASAPAPTEQLPVNYMGERLRRPGRSRADEPKAFSAVAESAQQSPEPSSSLMNLFGSELTKLKKLAIGTVLGLAHELIEKNLPGDLGHHLTEIVDDINAKLGGERIRGAFASLHNGAHHGNGREGATESRNA